MRSMATPHRAPGTRGRGEELRAVVDAKLTAPKDLHGVNAKMLRPVDRNSLRWHARRHAAPHLSPLQLRLQRNHRPAGLCDLVYGGEFIAAIANGFTPLARGPAVGLS